MQPEDVPHMGLDAEIGFRVESIEPDRVTGSFRVTPALFGRDGSLHRGVLSATVGSIASVAAASRVGDMDQVVDVTNSTSYFATVSSGTVSLVAEPVQVTPERLASHRPKIVSGSAPNLGRSGSCARRATPAICSPTASYSWRRSASEMTVGPSPGLSSAGAERAVSVN